MKNTSFLRKTYAYATTGLLILCSTNTLAENIPKLNLLQRNSDIVTTPRDGEPGILDIRDVKKGDSVEFTVNYIRNDMPMDVYLAFSTRPSNPNDWPNSFRGQLELDPESLEILAAVRIEPVVHFLEQETSLGETEFKTQTIVFLVELSDLNSPQLQGDEIFFQALAVPEKTMDFKKSQASELDHYEIVR